MKATSENRSSLRVMEGGLSSRKAQSTHRLNSLLEAVAQYQVIVIGDAILDEYVYISPLGMSNKDMNLTAEYKRKEVFQGGVYGAAAHLENFCAAVHVHTGSVVTTKRRFVEETYVRKFFTLYV